MEMNRISDELLREAVKQACEREGTYYEEFTKDAKHHFSIRHQIRMRRLYRKMKRKKAEEPVDRYRVYTYPMTEDDDDRRQFVSTRVPRLRPRLFLIVVLLMVGMSMTVFAIEPIREGIYQLIERCFSDHTDISFEKVQSEIKGQEEEIKELFEQFEAIANEYEGVECWSARELAQVLGYSKWERFEGVIERAKDACINAGEMVEYHFPGVGKMIPLAKGAQREVKDYMLTRYACYLIAQNGDPRKPQISFAQNYFAVQTRRAELVQKRLLEYERVQARAKLAETEKRLSGVLYERGVDSKGFAIIRSLGDKALFNLDSALLKRKLGAPNSRPLADFLPTLNIKAKDFAAEMTSVNVQQKDLHGQQTICQEHVDNNKAVRNMMPQRGIVPEDLPAGEDVKKVERRLKSDEKTLTKKNSKKK